MRKGLQKISIFFPTSLKKHGISLNKNCVSVKNAGGFSCLIELEQMDGKKRKFLLDSGWNYEWMDECFKREGIDKMLANNEIEAIFISHEHFDHYWGIPVTFKYNPNITVYVLRDSTLKGNSI
jgi:7,8-dihydropterin-6-yl-methyl-4-(beta-D-ribofuranosyl)aminobenzene 5'-phosphate synthase